MVALQGLMGRERLKKDHIRFSITPLEMCFALEARCFPGLPAP